jgi:Lactonase, 7-bladed beta-propeller
MGNGKAAACTALWLLGILGSMSVSSSPAADEPIGGEPTPTGKLITPTAAAGAHFQDLNPWLASAPHVRASHAAALSASPDGKLLAILTTGFNIFYDAKGETSPELSNEFVFLFDISQKQPHLLQVLSLRNTLLGLAWSPSSDRLFVSGGSDDAIFEFVSRGARFEAGRKFNLGHERCLGRDRPSTTALLSSIWYQCRPAAAGVAVSPDGQWLLAANLQNDSVTLLDLTSGAVVAEQDLRPGAIDPKQAGQAGGTFPRNVIWTATDRAYVGSVRDREIIALERTGQRLSVVRRIPVSGRPAAFLANRSGSQLYAALESTGQVVVIATKQDRVTESFDVTAPAAIYANPLKLGGANSNALALTPDERTLLISNGGQNSVAVVRLRNGESGRSEVVGLVPTGWYPTGVATSKDGSAWYVVNAKSPMGRSDRWCKEIDPIRKICVAKKAADYDAGESENGIVNVLRRHNEYNHQLERAGFLTLPAPDASELTRLTKQVVRNNRLDRSKLTLEEDRVFSALHDRIKHIIFILKENRSYDQVLGDLPDTNGDPRLTLFPENISPNHHAVARQFVTLDNFLSTGEASWTGWDWAFSAQTTDLQERAEPVSLGAVLKGPVGITAGSWLNRGLNVGYATSAQRQLRDPSSPADPDILAGAGSVYAPDGPGGEKGTGTIWDAALKKGLSVRSYGVFTESTHEPITDGYARKREVTWGTNASLSPHVNPYWYSGHGMKMADYWRVQEWIRELAEFSAKGTLPHLTVMSLHQDHFGKVASGADGVDRPPVQMADNDYALGLIVEAVANSPFAQNTLIVTVQDNAFDGPDHVDSQRSFAFFAGPYVRQGAVISMRYTTVNVVKTIEEILGIGPISLNTALAAPMTDVFDLSKNAWRYKAVVPDILRSTQLPLPPVRAASSKR